LQTLLSDGLKAVILQGIEPGADISKAAAESCANADIVVALTTFADSEVMDYADVVLPIAGFTETSGTFVNVSGQWQTFNAAVSAKGEARPAWKVLRVLGNLFELSGFDYNSSNDVLEEVKSKTANLVYNNGSWAIPDSTEGTDMAVNDRGLYQVDELVRRSAPLQATRDGQQTAEGENA
jgi:NADH-quinone oxidoreductase subunit G